MATLSVSDRRLTDLAGKHGTPLLVLDCAELRDRYNALSAALPGVSLYYALKAFSHPSVIKTLNALGAGFDIATTGEVRQLKAQHINPRNTIHTHPIKKIKEIKSALRFGCTTFVVDNLTELEKFVAFKNRVGLLLRISYRNPNAVVDLSRKFGCTLEEAPALLARARALGIPVKGLSFHVGSQCDTAEIQAAAMAACVALIVDQREAGSPLSILDIGGGFPANYSGEMADIGQWCAPLRAQLDQLPAGIDVIAEPGRYLVAAAVQGVFSVVGVAQRGDKPWYYLDDGVYGSFSGVIYDHARYPLHTIKQGPTTASTLVGPTCDSIDVIEESIELPALDVGDLIIGKMMGAYTAASATEFNSIAKAVIVSVNDIAEDMPEPVAWIA